MGGVKATLRLFLKRKFIGYIEYFLIFYYEQQMYNYFTNYHTLTCFDKSCVGQTGRLLKI